MMPDDFKRIAAASFHEAEGEKSPIEIVRERCAASIELISPSGKVEVFVHDDGRVFIHTLFSLDTLNQIDELQAQLSVAREIVRGG